VASRNIAAHDKSNWMTKTFFERISLNTQCPESSGSKQIIILLLLLLNKHADA
jgi:hypothetical protein